MKDVETMAALTNLSGSFYLSECNERISSLGQCSRDRVCSLCLSLGPNDRSLPFLLCLLDHKLGSFRILLCDLLLLNGRSKFLPESAPEQVSACMRLH